MESLVHLNGELVPEHEARISIFDIGFMYSAVFMEAVRTFKHKVFRLADHLERLERSMRYAGLPPLVSRDRMGQVINEVIEANIAAFAEDDDCWVCAQVTPGLGFPHPMIQGEHSEPTVMAYVSYLPYDQYARCYAEGKPAVVSNVRSVPADCVDPRAKTRFRLHYFMAKVEAGTRDPDAFPLLLDTSGYVTEGTGANFFVASNGALHTASTRNILAGISRRMVIELAEKLGVPVVERDLTLYDVYNADEAFWTTSSYCMLPVSRVNHIAMPQVPGPLTQALLEAWSHEVGVEIVSQATKYAGRDSNIWRKHDTR
jgi:branched-chain amino acid aminotransferase